MLIITESMDHPILSAMETIILFKVAKICYKEVTINCLEILPQSQATKTRLWAVTSSSTVHRT